MYKVNYYTLARRNDGSVGGMLNNIQMFGIQNKNRSNSNGITKSNQY